MTGKSALGIGVVTALALGATAAANAAQPTEITVWHAMGGSYGEALRSLTQEFNDSQSKYKVVTAYKGSYKQALTTTIAAYRAGNQPDIVQVYDVGTATMMGAGDVVIPAYKLMKDAGIEFSSDDFIPAVRSYYTNSDGQLISIPFNSSTPVLFYNKDAFKKAGLDPSKAPETWQDVYDDAKKLKESGAACAFTTTYPSWTQLENYAAWHNIAYANKNDGYAGLATKLMLNEKPFVQHIKLLGKMATGGMFEYGGRGYKASTLFKSGHCAMITDSSASYNVYHSSDFDVGESALPYDPEVAKKPQNTIIGGASFWALNGLPKDHLKGVARYLKFLSSVKAQTEWTSKTGYVPTTTAAYEQKKKQGFYDKNPGAQVPISTLSDNEPTKLSRGIRLGNFTQIRNIINQELESVWSGDQSAKSALDKIVSRGNKQLERFASSHK